MAEGSDKSLKVRSIYNVPDAKIPSVTDMKDSTLTYGITTLLSCFEAQKLNKLVYNKVKPAVVTVAKHQSSLAAKLEIHCLSINLFFFQKIEKLKKILKARCQSKPIDLGKKANLQEAYHHKSFLHERELEGDDEKCASQVPKIFNGFEVSEDQIFFGQFGDILERWIDYVSYVDSHKGTMNGSIAFLTLRTMIIFGEYCHLHKLRNYEWRLWVLAYHVAAAQNQLKTCIYITSRCLKLKYIDEDWITSSKNYIENNKELEDTEVVAIFWLELANFYFDCGKTGEARCLLERVKNLRCYNYPKQTNDPTVFGYTADIEFRNYFVDGEASQEGYVYLMAQLHYTLRDFHDSIDDKQKYDAIEYKLLGYSKMFDILCDIVMPTVSLHPHFEMHSHLNDWFLVAQRLGFTLRIADCLKYLCYIDLMLHRIEDCEGKLNELEKLLCLSKFKEWPMTKEKIKRTYVYNRPPYEDKKPEFEKKLFRIPDCSTPLHLPCSCFVCMTLDYSYAVFACTYIRAQVYCFVDYEAESEQYFCAGAKLQQLLDDMDSAERRSDGDYAWKKSRNYVVDYLMYLVDFGLFVAKFTPEKTAAAVLLFEKAIDVATENNLIKHPAAVFAIEMKFEHEVYSLDQKELFSAIYVPPIEEPKGEDKAEEEKGPMTRSKTAKLALEQKQLEGPMTRSTSAALYEGPMTRSKAAALLKAQASTSKK